MSEFRDLDALVARCSRAYKTPPVCVRDGAPDTIPGTFRALAETGRMVVYPGGTDTAIYSPAGNWLFRAWHDYHHTRTTLGFSVADEVQLARIQAAHAGRVVGDRFADIVWLEIAGQALAYEQSRTFLADQTAWTLRALRGPIGDADAFRRFL